MDPMWPKQNKYRNKKTMCLAKHWHSSKLEANYCDKLLVLAREKKITYKTQVVFILRGNNDIYICKHIVDFLVTYPDGQMEAHETKGYKTAAWSIKKKLFEAQYPHIKYVVVGGQVKNKKRGLEKLARRGILLPVGVGV